MMVLVLLVLAAFCGFGFVAGVPAACANIGPAVGPGPALPSIPAQSFKTTIRAVISNKNYTMAATEYVDENANVAAIIGNQNGAFTIIMHYDTNEAFYVGTNLGGGMLSPYPLCFAQNLSSDDNTQLFGMTPDFSTGLPHLYSTTNLLEFSSSFNPVYKGQALIDGIKTNHWTSCVYWSKLNANFSLDYYFSIPGWKTPSGLDQVPVRAVAVGTRAYPNGTTTSFNHIYQYVNFQEYNNDPENVFQTPPGVYCMQRKKVQMLPNFTNAFYYREEMSDPITQSIEEADIWYDYDLLLLRYDSRIIPTTNSIQFMDAGPFTVIHDYNTGVQYAIDQNTNQCDMSPIPIASVGFDAVQNITRATLNLRSPLAFFNLQSDAYLYAGQRKTRGVVCDVFQTVVTDLPGVGDVVYEVFFAAGVQVTTDVGKTNPYVPTKALPMRILEYQEGMLMHEYNIHDFDMDTPLYNVYDISPCYPDQKSSINFEITLSVEATAVLNQVQDTITAMLHLTIAQAIDMSSVRLQNVHLHWDEANIYFQAQLLDKAPPIAKYEKHAGQMMMSNFGKNLQGITSSQDCATNCDGLTEWVCTTFHYCSTTGICTLGKAVTGNIPVQNTSSCDYYTRVVGGGSNREVALSDAWNTLKNLVYHTGVVIEVPFGTAPDSGPNTVDQTQTLHIRALTITDQVFTGSRTLSSAAAMKQFNSIPGKQPKGYDEQQPGVSVDDCASLCISELTFTCQSFSYCWQDGSCFMSKQHPDENPLLLKPSTSCDLYYRDYTSAYEQIPGITLRSSSDTIYQSILSAAECAKLCTYYNAFHCQSFDYCPDINTCFLGHTHYYDTPAKGIEQSQTCGHYSRNYLDDFTAIQNKQVQLTQNRIIANVNPQQCAKLCAEELSFNCNTFDYCANRTWCRLFGAAMSAVGQVTTVDKAYCTVYKREYTMTINITTNATGVSTSANTVTIRVVAAADTGSNYKYTGGSMAGLAIAMIVIGLLIGAGIIYLLLKRQVQGGSTGSTYTKNNLTVTDA